MAGRIFDLPETKGTFQAKGIVNGVEKDRFYTSKTTKTGKDFRNINFGCAYDDKKSVYLSLNGMPQQNVYFSKRNQETGKSEVEKVAWANRNKFDKEGFRLIGVTLGLEKTTNKDGKLENLKKTMHAFDACEYIKAKMTDNSSVYIKGNLDFSSFTDGNGDVRRSIKYIPNQISLCQDVDYTKYDDDKNKPVHDFTQTIVFMGIDKDDTGRFIVSAKIVTYNDIVDTEFIIKDSKLANLFKKNLKEYYAITVHGKIDVSHSIQTVDEENDWGEVNPMDAVNSESKTELVITGAKGSTIDKETYTAKNVTEAIRKLKASKAAENNFVVENETDSSDSDWGDSGFEDEDEPW